MKRRAWIPVAAGSFPHSEPPGRSRYETRHALSRLSSDAKAEAHSTKRGARTIAESLETDHG